MPSIGRRNFLAATALGVPGLAAGQEGRQPNLLFVLTDQWRSSAFGFGSDAIVRTPHLDRLASEGANWRRAYAANPVCTPNRACILTGRYSHQTGMIKNDLQLPPAETCWPQVFRDAGYATHYVGKWHLDGTPKPGFVPPGWRRRGFATFEGFNRGHQYHKPWGFDDQGRSLEDLAGTDLRDYYEPAMQTDSAIGFMRRNRNRPFACYLSWGPPHTPFRPPRDFRRYTPEEITLRPNVPEDHGEQARKDLAGYYGLCESLDHQIGRITAFLDESGLSENTLVVFSSDHGELAGSHGKYRKGEPEDESLSVPLLMRLPGRIPAGTEPQALINSVDLMPTMLALCGLPEPGSCAGRDLSGAVLEDRETPQVESVYCEGRVANPPNAQPNPNNSDPRPWRSIVTARHKLTVRGNYGAVDSLYDLQDDPYELRNLADVPEAKSMAGDLLAELRSWGTATEDSFPGRPRAAKAEYILEDD